MKQSLPHGMKFTSLADIKAAVSGAYQDALAHAKREIGAGTYISRGRHFRVIKGGELVAGEAESWPWDGTLGDLLDAVIRAKFEYRADLVTIEGGINYANTPADYANGAYDPWVGEYEVTVWKKP